MSHTSDILIIGGGIVGLSVAQALKARSPALRITLLEKEPEVARHGSGRNSGVLHAGFYYPADSLKARFCRDGNAAWKAYCRAHNLRLRETRKLVVAASEDEVAGLHELKRRGDINGVRVELLDEKQATEIEPNARTHRFALYSPDTANVDPVEISCHLKESLITRGVDVRTHAPYQARLAEGRVRAGGEIFEAGLIINCAGLYADRIARQFGFGDAYVIMPFKGVYLKYHGEGAPPLSTNIYPVPNLKNPFLGVHFTLTVDGGVKIGPTAIPALWRQNYKGFSHFSTKDMAEIMRWQVELFATNAFGFRGLALEEMKKYRKRYLMNLAAKLVRNVDMARFDHWSTPGIRAQLLHKATRALVQDFVVEGDARSVHVLNAVSPAFTCALPFGEWVVKEWVKL